MRLTDDRYSRDWQRFDLAVRMIEHEARTGTIRLWTGLSDDRIRKLYRSYLQSGSRPPVRRHRGKTPTQTGFFLRNRDIRRQAALLAGIYAQLGLLALDSAGRPLLRLSPATTWGGLVLTAYEAYLELGGPTRITFEHACQLLDALLTATELDLAPCRSCASLMLVDRLRRRATHCTFCETGDLPAARFGAAATVTEIMQ